MTYMDAGFIDELLAGSYERRVTAVSEAVRSRVDLFGDGAEVLGTYGEHAIVLNPDGRAWRVQYETVQLGGVVTLGTIQPFNIPSKTDAEMSAATKDTADAVVDAMLSGDDEKSLEHERELLAMAQEGVALTTQTVAADVSTFVGSDFQWRDDIAAKKEAILTYLGGAPDMNGVPVPKYDSVLTSGSVGDDIAMAVAADIRALIDFYKDADMRLSAVADALERVPDDKRIDVEGFIDDLGEDVLEMIGYATESMATSDTDPMALVQVYDMLAGFTEDVLTGVLFLEKLVSDFSKAGE
jgi:hypothetical protein